LQYLRSGWSFGRVNQVDEKIGTVIDND